MFSRVPLRSRFRRWCGIVRKRVFGESRGGSLRRRDTHIGLIPHGGRSIGGFDPKSFDVPSILLRETLRSYFVFKLRCIVTVC